MDMDIDEYIHKEIQKKYQDDKKMIEKSISDYELHILNKYKKKHPLRLLSIYYLMMFRNKLHQLMLLPNEDEYEKINRENELFYATMFFPIRICKEDLLLQFPLIVNVSELSRNIDIQNSKKVSFNIDGLLANMAEGYQDDYDIDNMIRNEKRDILYEEKKRNSIIIMQESKATSCTIINGNHRIMYYSRMGQDVVDGYYITTAECCKFALTKEYETLYKLILHLIDKVTGSIDIEKNTP